MAANWQRRLTEPAKTGAMVQASRSPIEDYAIIGDCRTGAMVGTKRIDRLAVLASFR